MWSIRRFSIIALGAMIVAGGVAVWPSAPRFTLHNTGVSIDYPWPLSAARLAAALGVSWIAFSRRRWWFRLAGGLLAIAAALTGLDLLVSRIGLEPDRLEVRAITGRNTVRWTDVARVDVAPDGMSVEGAKGVRIRLTTRGYRPEQKAALERLVARRVATNPDVSGVR